MRRWLSRLATWTCMLIAVAAAVGWIVSVGRNLSVLGPVGSTDFLEASLEGGSLGAAVGQAPIFLGPIPWSCRTGPAGRTLPIAARMAHHALGFGWSHSPTPGPGGMVVFPLWAPLVAAVVTADVLRRRSRPRRAVGFPVVTPTN